MFIFQYHGSVNNRISRKIKAETRRGTRVISYGHLIENMALIQRRGEIFIYTT
jgi:hypothetical protein